MLRRYSGGEGGGGAEEGQGDKKRDGGEGVG